MCTLIIVCLLFINPIIGVADNDDLNIIMAHRDLSLLYSVFLLILIFTLGFLRLRHDKLWKITIVLGFIIINLYSSFMYFTVSGPLNQITIYDSVFSGVLKDSQSKEKVLKN